MAVSETQIKDGSLVAMVGMRPMTTPLPSAPKNLFALLPGRAACAIALHVCKSLLPSAAPHFGTAENEISVSPGATISTVMLGGVKAYELLHGGWKSDEKHASGGKSTV